MTKLRDRFVATGQKATEALRMARAMSPRRSQVLTDFTTLRPEEPAADADPAQHTALDFLIDGDDGKQDRHDSDSSDAEALLE